MYPVSAQGVDECMINVHYYYYPNPNPKLNEVTGGQGVEGKERVGVGRGVGVGGYWRDRKAVGRESY